MQSYSIDNNYLVKSRKLNSSILENICKCFSEDLTASEASTKIDISRVTINKYYKILRDYINLYYYRTLDNSPKYCYLKYFDFNKNMIFYIEYNCEIILLNDFKYSIQDEIKKSLLNNRKINCAKLLLNENRNSYLLLGYMNKKNSLNTYVSERLKKFRGINKNNIDTHIKESIFRFNNKNTPIFSNLTTLFI